MDKTYSQLEKEIADAKKREKLLKERVSKWRGEALEAKRMLKSLIIQYERIVKDWKKMYEDLIENGWKIVAIKFMNFINERRGKK